MSGEPLVRNASDTGATAPERAGAADPACGGDDGRRRFAAYVAHELRTPIALQRALIEVALADPDADAATLREMGRRILTSCLRQQRVIDALLDLAHSGRALAGQERVNLAGVAAQVLHAHDLGQLERVTALGAAWTSGNPHLLERLTANLVSNAVRHNIVGGRIEVRTRALPGRAVLTVANTGPVIPPCEVQRLFQPFQRLAPQSGDTAEGVGLGLAVVEAIADAHRAALAAYAQPAGGLRIDVALHAARGPWHNTRSLRAQPEIVPFAAHIP